MKQLLGILIAGLMSVSVNAAYITVDEPGMDAVFSQATFGTDPIDIRVGASQSIVAPSLLNLNSLAVWNSITGMHVGGANVVNFWFIDLISWCGNVNVNYVGCGETPGNDFVVESVFADSAFNAELLAHELGHNLNLPHNNGAGNLMDPIINGGTNLSAGEVTTIRNSPLVQQDSSGFYIDIIPIVLLAQADDGRTPVPATLALILVGLIGMRRRSQVRVV